MTNLRQAAAAALEALEILDTVMQRSQRTESAITALKQALAEPEQRVWCACGDSIEPGSGAKCGNCVAGDSAEPEQEPVAWMDIDEHGQRHGLRYYSDGNRDEVPLYTASTPRKPVELTDEEIALIVGECAASAYRHDDLSFARSVIAAYEKKQGEQT